MFPVNVIPVRNDGDDDANVAAAAAAAARSASELLTMTGIDVVIVVFRRRIESVGAKLVFRSSTRKS